MIYDLSIKHEKEQAITRFKYLLEKSKKVDLKEKRDRRSISQNAYLHLILSAFGSEFGYTLEEVKQLIFKQVVNADLFDNGEKGDLIIIQDWRSTSDLDTKEMTLAVNRFLDYSAQNGYRLPEPGDIVWIRELEKQIENNKQYL